MSKAAYPFKETDCTRAVRATLKAGLQPTAIEVDPKSGTIRVMVAAPTASTTAVELEPDDEWKVAS
jgi:hypothetical protein